MLPDELALMLYEHSRRPDFLNAIAAAMREGPEAAAAALTRWGRGVSFHEFELVFDDLSDYVAASNYEPALFAERPVAPRRAGAGAVAGSGPARPGPGLVALLARPGPQRLAAASAGPSFLRPWALRTTDSPGVAWTAAERLRIPDSADPAAGPAAGPDLAAGRRGRGRGAAGRDQPGAGVGPQAARRSRPRASPARLTTPPSSCPSRPRSCEIKLSRPGEIFFVGYDA